MPKVFSETELQDNIRLRMKARREAILLSQEALGAALGVTQQTIANYENGKTAVIPPTMLVRIAEELRCSLDQLYGVGEWASVPLPNLPIYTKAIVEIETFGEADRAFLLDMLFKHINELRGLNFAKAAKGEGET